MSHSIIVPNSQRPGSTAVRRAASTVGPQLSYRGAQTTYEIFQRGLAINPDGNCLGHRPVDAAGNAGPFVWQSYRAVATRIANFGAGLEGLGLIPVTEDGLRVLGIYSKNRPEWVIAQHACFAYTAVPVPMYDTLGADTIEYVANQTVMPTMLCSKLELATVASVGRACPALSTVIQMEPEVSPAARAACEAAGLRVLTFADVEAAGEASPVPQRPPAGHDICTFCYTSGTTGNPKGALITHANVISDFAAVHALGLETFPTDVHLSYLPLPHMFETTVQVGILAEGGAIGFFQGDTLKLLEDLAELRPTIFPSVPRLLTRIHAKLTAGVEEAGGIKKALFDRAYASKLYHLHNGAHYTHGLWDRLVFNKLRARLGLDRLRVMLTGSAPIAAHVLDFLRIVFCCPVHEGYGQTECSACATFTGADDTTTGHVGGPVPCCEIKLEDVPEMGYLSTDTAHGADPASGDPGIPCEGRGEICFRGSHVFAGYFKMPEKTAETIDADGWLHSGDIGLWTPEGKLKIVDRKKNIFKLAQGEYIAPEKIENIIARASLVAQSFVHGDSLQSCLVGVIVPDPETLEAWAGSHGLAGASLADLCRNPAVQQAVAEEVTAVCRQAELKGFEMLKRIHLEPEPWTAETGILTPTFKLKRNAARDHYREQIDAMYAEIAAAPTRSKL